MKLIKDGVDVNKQDDSGNTPLHILCYSCLSSTLVQALVNAGAKVDIKTNEGQTVLELVNMKMSTGRSTMCPEIKEILLKAGAR